MVGIGSTIALLVIRGFLRLVGLGPPLVLRRINYTRVI
jgi:hypothetical protein